jgi:hypothetical protein
MVTPFKTPVGVCQLPALKKAFNFGLSSVRIALEHCIGILKNHFFSEKNSFDLRQQDKQIVSMHTLY